MFAPIKENLKIPLTQRQQEIISILKESGPLSPKIIGQQLSESITDRTLRLDLANLKSLGILNTQDQARATIWFVIKDH